MQLDPCFVIHSIFHDAEKSLVCALANDDSLSNQFVAAKASRRGHRSGVTVCTSVQGWVEPAEVLCLGPSALGGHSKDARAADDKDTLVLDQFAVLYEEYTPVDVKNLALSVLAAIFLDVVIVSNLRSIAVRSHGVSIPACDLRDLCVEECAYIALLVHNLQHLSIDSDNTTNG